MINVDILVYKNIFSMMIIFFRSMVGRSYAIWIRFSAMALLWICNLDQLCFDRSSVPFWQATTRLLLLVLLTVVCSVH